MLDENAVRDLLRRRSDRGRRSVPHEVRVTRTAARQLTQRLPESVAAACVEFLYGRLSGEPRRVGSPLRKPYEGYWRARRGEYRVSYTIDDADRIVTVVDISPAATPTADSRKCRWGGLACGVWQCSR